MVRSLLCLFLLGVSVNTFAQIDSLTISDTIGAYNLRDARQPTAGYSYYGASQLASYQLGMVLKHSPDSLAQALYRQSNYQSWVSAGLVVGSVGLFLSSFWSAGRRGGTNGALVLAGYGTLLGSVIPRSLSSRKLAQAIASHNKFLRSRPDTYLPPVVYASTRRWVLSLADTITRRRVGLTYRYHYRSIQVYPGRQTRLLTASLNDPEVNQGIHYVQTINRITGLVGIVGRSLLIGYVTGQLLARNRRYRGVGSTLDGEFLTTGLLCLGANFVLTRHANRVQQRWVTRYNDLIHQRFQAQ